MRQTAPEQQRQNRSPRGLDQLGRLTAALIGCAAVFAPAASFAARAERPQADFTFRAVGEGFDGEPATGIANPNNATLLLPSQRLSGELREDMTVTYSRFRLDLRPRERSEQDWTETAGQTQYHRTSPDIVWNHATISARIGPLDASYGLENYQWGPGELTSPSNPLVVTQIFQQIGYYEVPGEHLLRLNAGIGDYLSLVLLYRPAFVLLRHPAKPAEIVFKPEYRGANGRWYVGLTAEAQEHTQPDFGGYGQYEFLDGLFVYADGVRQSQNRTLYPEAAPSGWTYATTHTAKAASNGLAGIRYNAASGNDVRLECLHQDSGYDPGQWRQLHQSLKQTPLPERFALLGPSLSPGPLLQSADYVYASLRLPDLGRTRATTLWLRALTALSDPSTFVTLGAQWNAGDHLQLLIEGHAAAGNQDHDLARSERWLANVGAMLSL